MPINWLMLEIDDQSMTENVVTFNMIDFHWFSSIFINYHRFLSIVILFRSVIWGLGKSISRYPGDLHVGCEMSMAISIAIDVITEFLFVTNDFSLIAQCQSISVN